MEKGPGDRPPKEEELWQKQNQEPAEIITFRTKKEKEMKHSSLYMPVAIIEILIGAALVLRPDAASIIFMYCVALALIWTGISTFMIWRQSEAADDSES